MDNRINRRFDIAHSAGGDVLYLGDLGLDENKLKELIPRIIKEFPELRELNLSNNGLIRLPEEIGMLLSIQELRVQRNQLRELPESLVELGHLHTLDLAENRLVDLPETLDRLPKIESINTVYNPLDQGTVEWLEATLVAKGVKVAHNREAYEELELPFQYEAAVRELFRNNSKKADEMIRFIGLLEDSAFPFGQKEINVVVDKIGNGKETGAKNIPVTTKSKQMVSGKDVLVGFLQNMPRGKGGVQHIYNTTCRYLFEELMVGKDLSVGEGGKKARPIGEIIEEIAICCGDGSLPVSDYLLQKAISIALQHPDILDPVQLDILLEREALQQAICHRMGKSIYDNQELLQAFVNSVYLEDAENNPLNKIRIHGERARLPSKNNYIGFGFGMVRPEQVGEFARICCKERNGELLQQENGRYVLDGTKMSVIKERYLRGLGEIFGKERNMVDFQEEIRKIREGLDHLEKVHLNRGKGKVSAGALGEMVVPLCSESQGGRSISSRSASRSLQSKGGSRMSRR